MSFRHLTHKLDSEPLLMGWRFNWWVTVVSFSRFLHVRISSVSSNRPQTTINTSFWSIFVLTYIFDIIQVTLYKFPGYETKVHNQIWQHTSSTVSTWVILRARLNGGILFFFVVVQRGFIYWHRTEIVTFGVSMRYNWWWSSLSVFNYFRSEKMTTNQLLLKEPTKY